MTLMERFSRQIPILTANGQEKLRRTKVLIVGLGGLGSFVVYHLACLGFGKLILIDPDKVSLTDLNRQILYDTSSIGLSKVEIAKKRLQLFNPDIEIEAISEYFNEDNGEELINKVDLVVDALDNWKSRLLLNRLCIKYGKPLIHGATHGWYGQVMTIIPKLTPCLWELTLGKIEVEKPVPVISPVVSIVASIQALEALRLSINMKTELAGKLLIIDGKRLSIEKIDVKRLNNCPICSSF